MTNNLQDLRIVAIGGGTGLATLLRGLREYVDRDGEGVIDLKSLTTIVTVTDDAGATGKLIDEFGILPPGDIRECLAALADEETLITRLFLHKFESEGVLSGLSFGNLFLTALIQMNDDNYIKAIQDASRVLRVDGNILPSTLEHVILCAEFGDGTVLAGEDEINDRGNASPIERVFLSRRPDNGTRSAPAEIRPAALAMALEAVAQADIVILGPGGLYTSIIPNLLVDGVSDAVKRGNARTVYIANVMSQAGKTDDYSLSDHIRILHGYAGFPIDYVLANNKPVSPEVLEKYREAGAEPIIYDEGESDEFSTVDFGDGKEVVVVEGSILCLSDIVEEVQEETIQADGSDVAVETKLVLRHAPAKLAAALIDVIAAAQD
jgi:uncharacterized cofD-like protein